MIPHRTTQPPPTSAFDRAAQNSEIFFNCVLGTASSRFLDQETQFSPAAFAAIYSRMILSDSTDTAFVFIVNSSMHHHSTDIMSKFITLFHPGIAATATGTVTPRRLAWNMPRIHSPLLLSCHALTRALLVLCCTTGTFSLRCGRGAS